MKRVLSGVVHRIPSDMRDMIISSEEVARAWNSLTPLARNEWICWIISVKRPETRWEHIRRASEELVAGKRRPCCWPGCPHRE